MYFIRVLVLGNVRNSKFSIINYHMLTCRYYTALVIHKKITHTHIHDKCIVIVSVHSQLPSKRILQDL